MFENIKRISEIRREAKSSVSHEYDENGREIMYMQVENDDGFLSPYSETGERVVSAEVAEFIDNSIKSKNLKKGLHIVVSSNVIDSQEKREYSEGIQNYYRNRVIEYDRKIKSNAVVSAVMTAVAVLIFALYVMLELSATGYIILAMIDIAAWVFMWEAVDLFFIERKVLKYEMLKNCAVFSAVITFNDKIK